MAHSTLETVPAVPTYYRAVAASFRRALEAEHKGPNTVETYLRAVNQFGVFLTERGMPTETSGIAHEHAQQDRRYCY
jgi:hypothetical protein